MPRYTCAYIKRDGTACGNKCYDPLGCYRHWKLYEKNQKKKPCLFSGCGYHTDNDSGCCSKHSAKFYVLNYRMRQKYEVEALQPRTPEASISESDDKVKTLQPRIYEASGSESDDEDVGLDLFGD